MRTKERPPKPDLPAAADLRPITRSSDRLVTRVQLNIDFNKSDWLLFGMSDLRFHENLKQWSLQAYLDGGATDFEHDSAYAIRLPLVGLHFDSLFYHQPRFTAWVDATNPRDFNVPTAGYDPRKMEGAHRCKTCTGKESHVIVPEDFYVPPFDPALFNMVKGQRVEITIGFVSEEDEE